MNPRDVKRAAAMTNQILLAANQRKPANSTNNVSFAELMRQLRGEA